MPEYNAEERALQKVKLNRTRFEIADACFKELKRKIDNPPDIKFGFPTLDKELWGLQKPRLAVVAARPSQGKSSLLSQLAWTFAKQDKRVIYVTLEMSAQEIMNRMMANEFGETLPENEDAWTGRLLEHPFLDVLEYGGRTIPELQHIYRLYKPDIIIIDYIQMISSVGFRSKQEAIAQYICDCKELSLVYNTAIVLASQINRAGSTASDDTVMEFLKGAGELEEAADHLFYLQWEGRYDRKLDPKDYRISLVKNRFGPRMTMELTFDAPKCRFAEKTKENLYEP